MDKIGVINCLDKVLQLVPILQYHNEIEDEESEDDYKFTDGEDNKDFDKHAFQKLLASSNESKEPKFRYFQGLEPSCKTIY